MIKVTSQLYIKIIDYLLDSVGKIGSLHEEKYLCITVHRIVDSRWFKSLKKSKIIKSINKNVGDCHFSKRVWSLS